MLCWDENDLNIDGDNLAGGRFRDTQERWEGIICKGNESFGQIGGPSSGAFNKRFEVATHPKGPIQVYYSPTDQRLHLFGADKMWLEVDIDYDNKPDMRYDYLDTAGDGYIDTWRFDVTGDGEPDDEWTCGQTPPKDLDYTWPEVNAVMKPLLKSVPERLFSLNARLQQSIAKHGLTEPDAVWSLITSGFDIEALTEDLRVRLLSSDESLRFYLDLLKDRLIAALKTRYDAPEFWRTVDGLRARGDLENLRALVENTFDLDEPLPSLLATREAILLKYAKPRVAWAEDWVPPNIGWESDVCGYRAYWGQFDFFGKKRKCLVMSTFGEKFNYHEEQDWGMDALHVGKTCGLGGVTLYVNGQAYPVWSPEGEGDIVWSKRLVEENDDEVVVELIAEQVGPEEQPYTVRFRCTAVAGRKDSPIEVTVQGGSTNDTLELGIGMTKLPQEAFALDTSAGVMAGWGVQDPAIGTIGMGVVYPTSAFVRCADLPDQHQVVLKIKKDAPVRYHIQGDWLRGRRFPRCPTIENWLEDLRATAAAAGFGV